MNQSLFTGSQGDGSLGSQRFYVHEVIAEERTDMPFKTGDANSSAKPGGTSSPSVISLLDKIKNVKEGFENDAENNGKIGDGSVS